jgi:hypothetical protein
MMCLTSVSICMYAYLGNNSVASVLFHKVGDRARRRLVERVTADEVSDLGVVVSRHGSSDGRLGRVAVDVNIEEEGPRDWGTGDRDRSAPML